MARLSLTDLLDPIRRVQRGARSSQSTVRAASAGTIRLGASDRFVFLFNSSKRIGAVMLKISCGPGSRIDIVPQWPWRNDPPVHDALEQLEKSLRSIAARIRVCRTADSAGRVRTAKIVIYRLSPAILAVLQPLIDDGTLIVAGSCV